MTTVTKTTVLKELRALVKGMGKPQNPYQVGVRDGLLEGIRFLTKGVQGG